MKYSIKTLIIFYGYYLESGKMYSTNMMSPNILTGNIIGNITNETWNSVNIDSWEEIHKIRKEVIENHFHVHTTCKWITEVALFIGSDAVRPLV